MAFKLWISYILSYHYYYKNAKVKFLVFLFFLSSKKFILAFSLSVCFDLKEAHFDEQYVEFDFKLIVKNVILGLEGVRFAWKKLSVCLGRTDLPKYRNRLSSLCLFWPFGTVVIPDFDKTFKFQNVLTLLGRLTKYGWASLEFFEQYDSKVPGMLTPAATKCQRLFELAAPSAPCKRTPRTQLWSSKWERKLGWCRSRSDVWMWTQPEKKLKSTASFLSFRSHRFS